MCNYHCTVPKDEDDGSNSYVDTNNVLLYGGTKSLMGYNKHHIGNAMVYVDYLPALTAPASQRIGWSAPQTKPPMCSGMITPTPDVPGMSEVWANNTCIASDPVHFFRWYNCNESNVFDGGIPNPLSGNRYYTPGAGYVLHCGYNTSWNLQEAQERGLEVGSSLHTLPSTEELLGIMQELLGV